MITRFKNKLRLSGFEDRIQQELGLSEASDGLMELLADALVGVGLARAEAIVADRQANGEFRDPYELTAVKGIGDQTVEHNEANIRLRD